MNFNFKQHKFSFAPPIMRQYSTIGLGATKPEQNDFGFKSENIFKKVQSNLLNNFGSNVFQNKSFSNPNFVNKQNPNIFTSCISSHFDKPTVARSIYENVKNSCVIQSPKHVNHSKIPEENHIVYQPIPDKISSQHKSQMPVHKDETVRNNNLQEEKKLPDPITISPKSTKKNTRNRRNRKGKRSKQELIPIEPNSEQNLNQKTKMAQKKSKKMLCSSPKKMKKDCEFSKNRNRKGKKGKPWHKISLGMEIMECEEANFASPETPNCPVLETPLKPTICIELKSSPIEISPKFNANLCETSLSMSISPCTEFLKNLSTSNTSASDYSSSPASPAIRRLRMPSECDSEDNFIVFCDDVSSCMSETEVLYSEDDELSDTDEDDSESDLDIVDFCENTDLNKETAKKKVCFKMDSELCDVHPMIHWNFAYQKARIGPWEQFARDRARFETRILKTESILSSILQPDHRELIYRERFANPDK